MQLYYIIIPYVVFPVLLRYINAGIRSAIKKETVQIAFTNNQDT